MNCRRSSPPPWLRWSHLSAMRFGRTCRRCIRRWNDCVPSRAGEPPQLRPTLTAARTTGALLRHSRHGPAGARRGRNRECAGPCRASHQSQLSSAGLSRRFGLAPLMARREQRRTRPHSCGCRQYARERVFPKTYDEKNTNEPRGLTQRPPSAAGSVVDNARPYPATC
jgi:hypothetical protein